MRTRRPDKAPTRQRLATVALVALAAVTVLLVVLAVEHTTSASTGGHATLRPHPSGTSVQGRPDGVASPAASPTGSGRVLLALADDGTLVTAEPGACGGAAPAVRLSTDGGASFQPVRTEGPLSSVLAVSADSADELSFTGTDADCAPQRYAGSTADGRWPRVASGDTSWHLLPGEQAVHTPDGPEDIPCRPVSLSPAAPVRVLCADSRVIGSADQGASWVVLGRLEAARLIAFTSPSVGYAVARRPSCAAALLTTDDGGATWTRSHCFEEGPVRGLAAAGRTVAALVGDQVWGSTDGGDTWTAA